MSHGRRSESFDHARIAKTGFLVGLGLFVVGVVGELAGHAVGGPVPAAAEQLLLGMEIAGVAVGFFVPVVFGAILPLME